MIVAKFEKVSFEQFSKDIKTIKRDSYKDMNLEEIYNNIKLPERATIGSAGYDFFYPYKTICLLPNTDIVIPSGIKCKIIDGWWLGLFPKSSFGNNYKCQLEDTVSVIDSDYYNCEKNEGNIFIKLSNNDRSGKVMTLEQGKAYCQGIFIQYGLAEGDNVTTIRKGGLGSTNK